MKRRGRVTSLFLVAILCAMAVLGRGKQTQAITGEPDLLIGQVKITSSNGQFISLYNNSDHMVNMSKVQLAYYNNYDLSLSPASKIINLSGELAPGNYYLVSDDSLMVCYKMIVHAASLGFSTSGGMLQVLQLTQGTPGGQVSSVLLDWIAWAKASTTGVLTDAHGAWTLPKDTTSFLSRVWPADGQPKTPGAGTWQTVSVGASGSCDLQAQISASVTPSASSSPSAVKAAVTEKPPVGSSNSGLVAPELTEIFPNPASPQTDEADEFVELYNPNPAAYDLTGYRLEAGSTYSKGYTFKSGSIEPKSYASFSITETKLQLTNSEGQVRLLDRDGGTISETAPYEDAPAGSTWSLVGDSWQWSTKPTPGVVNTASTDKEEDAAGTSAKKTISGKVAGVSTTSSEKEFDDAAPLHPLVLAAVGLGAVAYALYEYRRDMANRIFQLRRYLRSRRQVRARL